jgi:hypothetical protein
VLQATIGVSRLTGLALLGNDVVVASYYSSTVLDIDPTFSSTSLYSNVAANPIGLAGGKKGHRAIRQHLAHRLTAKVGRKKYSRDCQR